MARIRYIKPEFFEDEKLGSVSPIARLLYIALFCHLDRSGVAPASYPVIKAKAFPFDESISISDVKTAVEDLVKIGRLQYFEHENQLYLFCPSFAKHQLFHKNERAKFALSREEIEALVKHRTSTVLAPYLHPKELVTGNGERVIGNGELVTGLTALPKKPKPQKAKPEPDGSAPSVQIRDAFFKAYRQEYGRDYTGWGPKEYTQANNWLRSVSLETAIRLCGIYPKWNNEFHAKNGHPFGPLTTDYVKLDSWAHSSTTMIKKIAAGKAAENVDLKRAIDTEENKRGLEHKIQQRFGGNPRVPGGIQGLLPFPAEERIPTIDGDPFGGDVFDPTRQDDSA